MTNETILRLANRIYAFQGQCIVERVKWEEQDGYYNVWKIIDANSKFILKRVSAVEKEIYEKIADRVKSLPKFLGETSYRGATYILISFEKGENLMNCTRGNLIKVVDAIADIQNEFWNTSKKIGSTIETSYDSLIKRKEYAGDDELERAFDVFFEEYKTVPKTLCHEDLLPFNVIVREEVKFIDWEHAGILPYPTMLARLLAHTSEHGETPFYMSKGDLNFAIDYYFEQLVRDKGITLDRFKFSMDCFLFYESLEWVYVYNKNKMPHDEFFDYYYNLAKERAKKVLR